MLPEALSNDALLARAPPGPPRGHRRARLPRRRGGPQRVPPLADPLRRAAGLPAGRPRPRRRPSRAEAPWGEPLAVAREVAAALADAARGARRARGRVGRAGVRLLARRARHGPRAVRADRVAPADRAPDDRRERGRRDAAGDAQAARALPRARAAGAARVQRLAEQLAALDVPTPRAARDAVAAAGRRRGRRALAARRRARAPHGPRPGGAHLARAALAQAGALLAAQRRALRAALAALLPLHVADPALPRPDLPPRAARRDRGGGGRAGRVRDGGRRRVVLDPRARRGRDRAPGRRRRALLPARGRAVPARLGDRVAGRGDRRDRRRRLRGLRRRARGAAAGPAPARRLVGARPARGHARRRAVGQGDPAGRPGRPSRSCTWTRPAGAPTSPP